MKNPAIEKVFPYIALLLIMGGWLIAQAQPVLQAAAQTLEQSEPVHSITGLVTDEQGEPIGDVEIQLMLNGQEAAVTSSQPDGSYLLPVPDERVEYALVIFERPHFGYATHTLNDREIDQLNEDVSIRVDIVLVHTISAGFWVATTAFLAMLALIATEQLQKTIAALLGTSIVFGASTLGAAIYDGLYIFSFERGLEYVDWDVVFLLLGMMIVIGIIEDTGIFQWMAFRAYKLSRGKAWLLATILMVVTAVASALLDNVTTMLLMTPITIEIALAMGLNPLALLLPEVLASNVGGISTLIGTPTNILIGSYAGLGFSDFLVNLTPGVVLALFGLTCYALLRYRKEYKQAQTSASPSLLEHLEQNARIRKPEQLTKSGVVFGVLLLLFIFGEPFHLEPAVSALLGAVAMLIWIRPDMEETLRIVDWTTLLFFIGLFIVIGAIQEVGLIFLIAEWIAGAVGQNPVVALLVIVWAAALMSGLVDNIPFAAAMLPVVSVLSSTTGVRGDTLFYGLSVGAAMGGNTSLIGASANLVTAGIAQRAGYKITFKNFFLVGFPAMLITVTLGTVWLLIRFF